MKKFLMLTMLTLATPLITIHSEALAFTPGPLPKDVIYSSDGTFDSPNIFFNNPTDTIQISGQTVLGNQSTYEARIYFPSDIGANGVVFDEFKYSFEDKWLSAGPDGLAGYNFPNYPNEPLTALKIKTPLATNTWHHIAFVQGGGTQRLYLNGQIVGSRPGSGDIWDSDGGGFLGAILRQPGLASSFIGHLDTFRISNVPRYTGNSFEAPTGDFTSDRNTQLLYNFNLEDYFQQNGRTWISDLSGNGRHGRFGTGFTNATSPSIIIPVDPEPPKRVPESSSVLGLLVFSTFGISSLLKCKRQERLLDSIVTN